MVNALGDNGDILILEMKTVAVALESQHFGFGEPTSGTPEILRRKRAGA